MDEDAAPPDMDDDSTLQADDTRALAREAFFISLIVLWLGFICYVGVMGNVVTTALGLSNTYAIKVLATTVVGTMGTALLVALMRRTRRQR